MHFLNFYCFAFLLSCLFKISPAVQILELISHSNIATLVYRAWDTWTPSLGVRTWSGQSTHSLLRIMALDLEELILIPANSLLATKQSSERQRSQTDCVIRTTWSANRNNAFLSPSNCNPPLPWLTLEILSMKITNRTGDEVQPWWRPTPTSNNISWGTQS